MAEAKDIIQLSNRAFWDVDMSKLDYEKQANSIIVRVFERGSWEDILEVCAFYSNKKLSKLLLTHLILCRRLCYLLPASLIFHHLFLNVILPDSITRFKECLRESSKSLKGIES